MLDTSDAIEYCGILEWILQVLVDDLFLEDRENLSRAVYHIHTCLTKRVQFVLQSCKDLAPGEASTFHGTPFDIPNVVEVLKVLAKSSKASILVQFVGVLVVFIMYFFKGKAR